MDALCALHALLSKEQTDGSCFGQSCLSLASDPTVQSCCGPNYSKRAAKMPEKKRINACKYDVCIHNAMLQCLFVVLVGFQHLCGVYAAVWVIHGKPWISHRSTFNLLPFVCLAVTTFNINLGKTFYFTLLGRFIRLSSTCALVLKFDLKLEQGKQHLRMGTFPCIRSIFHPAVALRPGVLITRCYCIHLEDSSFIHKHISRSSE